MTVPDLDLATAYYTEVMGLEIGALADDSVYLKCWDEADHHSLRLRYAAGTVGPDVVQGARHEDDLADLERRAPGTASPSSGSARARPSGRASRSASPPRRAAHGARPDVEKVGVAARQAEPRPDAGRATRIAPPRMDHMLVTAEEVGESRRFYLDVLGFRMTEQLLDGNGHQLGTWLERSRSPHDLAIVLGPNGGLHHIAFWLDDWDDVRDAADILAYNGIQLDVGPTRHGITRG